MSDSPLSICVRLSRDNVLKFQGKCLARVVALNHDDSVRRRFSVYACASEFVAERIDDPGSINVRYWGVRCVHKRDIYEFFGNEPLANYLYGYLMLEVPGLRCVDT